MAGQCSLILSEFWNMTPREFSSYFSGYIKNVELREHQAWERMRMQSFLFVNTQIKRQIKNPQKLIKFPWEEQEVKLMTAEQKEFMQKHM
jgi:hypothetical protein